MAIDTSFLTRGDVMSAKCPSREVLNHLTSRWAGLILMALHGETLRFAQLRRQIDGISERMLAQTLQTLVADGFIDRKEFKVVPPHVEYSLTPLGTEAAERVFEMARWIEGKLPEILSARRS